MPVRTIFKYPLDLTGTSSENRALGERHTIGVSVNRIFIPDYGPFFGNSLVVRDVQTGQVLTPVQDYRLVHTVREAQDITAQPVYHGIYITALDVSNDIEIDVNYVGGEYSYSVTTLYELVKEVLTDNRNISWGQLIGVPNEWVPAPHLHSAYDLYAMKHVVASVQDVAAAIREERVAAPATRLMNPQAINGTDFDGTEPITTRYWGRQRNFTIGKATRVVDGGEDVEWTLSELGLGVVEDNGEIDDDPNETVLNVIVSKHHNTPGMTRTWYISTIFHGEPSLETNRAQTAIEYNPFGNTAKTYVRIYHKDKGWTQWSMSGGGNGGEEGDWIPVELIPELDASNILEGTFGVDRIPGLSTDKIGSGVFDVARIPGLSTDKITTGILPVSRGGYGVDTVQDAIGVLGLENTSFSNQFISTGDPTGMSDGDIWYQVDE